MKDVPLISEKDYQEAAAFRAHIHEEALRKAQAYDPSIEEVFDRHPVEAYILNVWEYPGEWYHYVGVPEGYNSRDALVRAIVSDTLKYGHKSETKTDIVARLKKILGRR